MTDSNTSDTKPATAVSGHDVPDDAPLLTIALRPHAMFGPVIHISYPNSLIVLCTTLILFHRSLAITEDNVCVKHSDGDIIHMV